jgi:hypothetical protein
MAGRERLNDELDAWLAKNDRTPGDYRAPFYDL